MRAKLLPSPRVGVIVGLIAVVGMLFLSQPPLDLVALTAELHRENEKNVQSNGEETPTGLSASPVQSFGIRVGRCQRTSCRSYSGDGRRRRLDLCT